MRAEGILARGRKPKPEDRACFEMLLEKLRDIEGWHDCDRDERMGGKGRGFFCRLARLRFTDGTYAKALETFGPYDGIAAPSGYTLPPVKIYGEIDDSPEDVVECAVRQRSTSPKGITADGAGRAAA